MRYFRIVRVEGPDRVWVRPNPLVAPSAPRLAVATAESILVTTVPRMFSTRVTDAGLNYDLTVIASSVMTPPLAVRKTLEKEIGSPLRRMIPGASRYDTCRSGTG